MRQAHALLARLATESGTDVAQQRAAYVQWTRQFPTPPGTVTKPLGFADGTWVSAPGPEPQRVVLHLHGGAYRLGSPDTHLETAARIAAAAHARVALLDYPLAPEHPFPAALDAAQSACTALLGATSPGCLAITGESAGGGLALATLLRLRDQKHPLPACAAVLSPWVDLRVGSPSMAERAHRDPFLTQAQLQTAAAEYLADAGPGNPYASPLLGDLSGLPPLLVQVGTEEILHDEALALHRRAEQAGVDSQLMIFPGAPHIWQHFASFLPQAQQAISAVGNHVRHHTHPLSTTP
ncbi:alpha/beta hydrolase fold domain-containing protein [Streptomyces sp. NPDC001068]|uniref:alpha/beta hydrolase fold domain-containing protein n=1 Tax=Streptomyces sp. NPDC001068 TaxID=3364544 RepID=UPI0036AEBE23